MLSIELAHIQCSDETTSRIIPTNGSDPNDSTSTCSIGIERLTIRTDPPNTGSSANGTTKENGDGGRAG